MNVKNIQLLIFRALPEKKQPVTCFPEVRIRRFTPLFCRKLCDNYNVSTGLAHYFGTAVQIKGQIKFNAAIKDARTRYYCGTD